MRDITLTEHQQDIFNQIMSFIHAPGAGIFILKGYAGTGKTTLLQYIASQLHKENRKFALLASTGRAASVLRSKTNFSASTIHSEIYKFSGVDGDEEHIPDDAMPELFGDMTLQFGLRMRDEQDDTKVYIVDEASMVSNVLTDNKSFAHFGSGLLLTDFLNTVSRNKVIFTGDPAQLPPVAQQESPALSEDWFNNNHIHVKSGTLTEILRQKSDNDILVLATRIRKMVNNTPSYKWIKIPVAGIRNVELLPSQQMKEEYVKYTVSHGYNDTIAVAHSNRNCNEINRYVRKTRYGDENAPLQIGDILMVTQNNHIVPLVNGDFVEVIKIGDKQFYSNLRFVDIVVKAKHNDTKFNTLLCLDTLYNGRPNITSEQQRLLMINFSMRLRRKNVRPKTQAYNEALRKDPFLNSLRANFGYAVTCHKSQGGEWKQVFFFLNKSMYVMKKKSLARWWYTGITRAKEKLYLTDDWWIKKW